MRLHVSFALLLLAAASAKTQPSLTYCDLIRNPEKYNGKEVTIRATWRVGYEWSYLYCLDCTKDGKTWLNLTSDLDDASKRAIKNKDAGIANVTVRGVFMSGGGYGHQSGYRYQIVPSKLSDVKVIVKGLKSPAKEQEAERRWACGGTRPK